MFIKTSCDYKDLKIEIIFVFLDKYILLNELLKKIFNLYQLFSTIPVPNILFIDFLF